MSDQPAAPALLRPMTLEDVPQVQAIDQLSFSLPWPESSFKFELTENENSLCQVAEVDGRIAAMIVVWIIVDEAHVGTIATHPNFRGRGLARRLLAHTLLQAIPLGAALSMLEVRRSNMPAMRLYETFGFEICGERRHYYQDNGEDALLMTLPALDVARLQSFLTANPSQP